MDRSAIGPILALLGEVHEVNRVVVVPTELSIGVHLAEYPLQRRFACVSPDAWPIQSQTGHLLCTAWFPVSSVDEYRLRHEEFIVRRNRKGGTEGHANPILGFLDFGSLNKRFADIRAAGFIHVGLAHSDSTAEGESGFKDFTNEHVADVTKRRKAERVVRAPKDNCVAEVGMLDVEYAKAGCTGAIPNGEPQQQWGHHHAVRPEQPATR